MAEIDLAFIARQLERLLEDNRALRNDIADLKADMEVQSAIIGRMDNTMQGLVGEVRALTGQQSRQRQRLDRVEERVGAMEETGE